MKTRTPRQKRSNQGPARGGVWLALFALVFLNFAHGLHGPWMPGMGFVPAQARAHAPTAHTSTTHTPATSTHATHAHANHAPTDHALAAHAAATHDPVAVHHHHADDEAATPAGDAPHGQHQMPPMCPLCQAMHAMGGVLPVVVFVLVRHLEPPAQFPAYVHAPRTIVVCAASARGPPRSV